MIGINNIASYIPANRESNFNRKDDFGIDDDFIINKLGVERVSRKSADEDTADLCLSAFVALKAKVNDDLNNIDCLVVCTQNPEGKGIPHTSAVVHGKLDFSDDCACFDLSLGCSGYVYTLSVVKAFMEANGLEKGLVFTADPYSKIINPKDKNTALLFGDAATVTFLTTSGRWEPKKFVFSTRGKSGDALHNRGKYLFMNGRMIFNFSSIYVPLQVKKLLDKVNLTYSDIDLFLFHQGSKFVVNQLCRRMELPEEKVPVKLSDYGNTVSSSIPLLLEEYLNREDIRNIVMSGFGVGLSWASCLLGRH